MNRKKEVSMLANKILALLVVVLASALVARPGLAEESAGVAKQRMIAPALVLAPGMQLTGKRPPLLAKRAAWLDNLAGDTLFMVRFGQAFETLDKNHDGLLQWAVIDGQGKLHPDQAGAEPLPTAYDACYLIDYVHHPAKTEKDPAHPGQYIDIPESYEITGWRTWKEVLASLGAGGYAQQTPTGVCNKTEKQTYCKKGPIEYPRTCTWGQCNCYPGVQGATLIQKDVCVEPQTVATAYTRDNWLKLAKDHFQREDWNHDGKLDAEETKEFVCAGE
jgi:hypothetical protein